MHLNRISAKTASIALIILLLALAIIMGLFMKNNTTQHAAIIALPQPHYKSNVSIEEALLKRRSIRDYQDAPISLEQISQLLWAAQGITSTTGLRTAPSAGALYPLEIYLVTGKVSGLNPGVYHYNPTKHALELIATGDKRNELGHAALSQQDVQKASVDIVISGDYQKTTVKYGDRGVRYVYMEAGHVAENIYLEITSLGLGTVTLGAFDNEAVKSILHLPNKEDPLYIMPVGKPF